MKQKSLKLFLTKNDTVHYTLCYTPDKSRCNVLFYNDIFLLKLLIILWSLVQVQVGPPVKQNTNLRVGIFLTYVFYIKRNLDNDKDRKIYTERF